MDSVGSIPENHRPEKRQRVDAPVDASADGAAADGHAAGGGDAPPPPPSDQISAALAKIASHISNKAKFPKASQLLRQLIDAIDKTHRHEYFYAIKQAFANADNCIEPLLRKDYVRLMKAVITKAEVLSKQQQRQLDAYSNWALLRNELFTDDSFIFSKVVAKIKAAVSELPDADDEQEAAWEGLLQQAAGDASAIPAAAAAAAFSQQQQHQAVQQQQPATAQAAAAAEHEEEADPFGLNDFIAKAEAEAAAAVEAAPWPSQPSSNTAKSSSAAMTPADHQGTSSSSKAQEAAKLQGQPWDAATLQVMKKQSLLDCLIAAKTHCHKLAWARTGVEMLIEGVAKPAAQGGHIDKFIGGQKHQLQDLLKFVNAERAARRSGVNRRPGGKGTGDYMTSFERARAEWGAAGWVSARGKIGSQSDAKANNWLG